MLLDFATKVIAASIASMVRMFSIFIFWVVWCGLCFYYSVKKKTLLDLLF